MTEKRFNKVCNMVVDKLKNVAPIDTGNLRYNAIKMEFTNPNECHIFIDEAIAPYMPFTNEPWISPKWHGKKNPNEHWFDDAADYIASLIGAELKTDFTKTEQNNDTSKATL